MLVTPNATMAASRAAQAASIRSMAISSFRRGSRSAVSPPMGPSTR